MQLKHLIIFALVGIVALLGFNIVNSNQREKNREAIAMSSQTSPATDATSADNNDTNASTDIASKPLGQQPKAIMDKATTQIEQAEQVSQQRNEQITATQ